MNDLEKAQMVATWAHRDQTDMSGEPYIAHCARVANNVRSLGFCEAVQAIAWLHDVVEDTTVKWIDLSTLGFDFRILKGVQAMTKEPHEELETYWTRVRACEDARIVKLYGDIPDNNDPGRKAGLAIHIQERLSGKYARAIEFLSLKPSEYTNMPLPQFPHEVQQLWFEPRLGDVGFLEHMGSRGNDVT